MESEVIVSRTLEAVSEVSNSSYTVEADSRHESRDAQETMSSVSSQNADGCDNGTKI